MIEKIEQVALEERPDWILVYGDTNSTVAGAIVVSNPHKKFVKSPKEVTRILKDRVSFV